MKATRTINGVHCTWYGLYDTAQTGEYEDDIVRQEWITVEEAMSRNEILRNHDGEGSLRWFAMDVEPEEHDDTPSLDMELYY